MQLGESGDSRLLFPSLRFALFLLRRVEAAVQFRLRKAEIVLP